MKRIAHKISAIAALLVAVGVMASPGLAQPVAPINSTRSYENCTKLADNAPDMAIAVAEEWQVDGGGLAARHCAALALARSGQYAEAARQLESIADASRSGEPFEAGPGIPQRGAGLLAELYAQAGNAWLLAEDAESAEVALSQGLVEAAQLSYVAVDLYVDRARAREAMGLNRGALEDLDEAYGLAPDRIDVLVFRASILRRLDRYAQARDAVERALELEPDNREGLLERANIRAYNGDDVGAEADLNRIIALYPDSIAARVARESLNAVAETRRILDGDAATQAPADTPPEPGN